MPVDIRCVNNTILHAVQGRSNEDVIVYLLKKGADINEKDPYGITALIFAVTQMNPTTVELLMKHGADCNVKGGAKNKTAVEYAGDIRDEDLKKRILELLGCKNARTTNSPYVPEETLSHSV